jgi:hypothetical protein
MAPCSMDLRGSCVTQTPVCRPKTSRPWFDARLSGTCPARRLRKNFGTIARRFRYIQKLYRL